MIYECIIKSTLLCGNMAYKITLKRIIQPIEMNVLREMNLRDTLMYSLERKQLIENIHVSKVRDDCQIYTAVIKLYAIKNYSCSNITYLQNCNFFISAINLLYVKWIKLIFLAEMKIEKSREPLVKNYIVRLSIYVN